MPLRILFVSCRPLVHHRSSSNLPVFYPHSSLSQDRQLLLDALSLLPVDISLCMPEAPTVRMIQNEIERSEAFDILVHDHPSHYANV